MRLKAAKSDIVLVVSRSVMRPPWRGAEEIPSISRGRRSPFYSHRYFITDRAGKHESTLCRLSFTFRGPTADPATVGKPTQREDHMPTFMVSLNWTDQGVRTVKDAPKRAQASRELAKKVGVEIQQVYLTSGEDDVLIIVDSPNGDNVAKFALALGSQGNVRTRTARAWPESEFQKLISELP